MFHLTEGSKSKYYVLHRDVSSGNVYVVNSQYHPGLYSSEAFLDMGNLSLPFIFSISCLIHFIRGI